MTGHFYTGEAGDPLGRHGGTFSHRRLHPIHGQGTYTAPNGNKYVGEWKNSKPHGQGTLTYADGGKVIPGKKKPSPTDAEEGCLFLENVI